MFRQFRPFAVALALVVAGPLALPEVSPPAFADARAMRLPVDPTPLVAVTEGGEKAFSIEIADEDGEQARGLMFRTEMPDDRGMLFDLGGTRVPAFWMENTPMPLDLVFINEDGRVGKVMEGVPFSRATISPGAPMRFVLELKQGTASKLGIKPGDRLRHPAIDAVAGSQ